MKEDFSNLSIEWDYTPKDTNKRLYGRLTQKELVRLLVGVNSIPIKIRASHGFLEGILIDISAGGVCVIISGDISEYSKVKIFMNVGKKSIATNALVCYSNKIQSGFKVGLKFMDLSLDICEYISELYASKVLTFGSEKY